MRPALLFFLALALLRFAPAARAQQPPTAAEDEQVILRIQREWWDALVRRDVAYLDALFLDEWVFTNGRGEMNHSKADELAEVREGAVRYTRFDNSDLNVRVRGDTAVLTGRTKVQGTIVASGQALNVELRFTATFARVGGRWRALAEHVSRVEAR